MKRKRNLVIGMTFVTVLAALWIVQSAVERAAAAQAKSTVMAPKFEVDPFWPKPLPNHWILGQTIGVWVDTDDHIWIVHRSSATLADNEKGLELKTADDYQKMVRVMDEAGVGVICNMDGGFGPDFDRAMKVGEPYRDRILHFARLNFDGINEPGWSAKTAAELERDFLAGAAGLKINKVLGLDLQNPDGTYIQADDKRFDPVWEMCAKHNRPVMIHISDSYGRFLPIGPENERYEAGLWRSSPEGNYYKTGQPTPDVIEKARENMHAKHPKTRFVNAHMAMLYYDMDKVAALLDKYPNADVELSATVQDLGRAPLMIRKFFLKYQNRILFGSDWPHGEGVPQPLDFAKELSMFGEAEQRRIMRENCLELLGTSRA